MCTLVAWIDAFEGHPLIVAANRDERLGRPASGPGWREGDVRYVAPRDETAGGTWWALNANGLFVAITNRFGVHPDNARRSRGLLVSDVAQKADFSAASAYVEAIGPKAYNGFHLFVTDGREGLVAVGDAVSLHVQRLGRGRHIVSERSFGASETSRDAAVRRALDAQVHGLPTIEVLQQLLATHSESPIDSVCVHLPEFEYGTRSSTVLVVGPAGRQLRFAPGPPCRTSFENLDAIVG